MLMFVSLNYAKYQPDFVHTSMKNVWERPPAV